MMGNLREKYLDDMTIQRDKEILYKYTFQLMLALDNSNKSLMDFSKYQMCDYIDAFLKNFYLEKKVDRLSKEE